MARAGRRRLFSDTHVMLAIAIAVAGTIIEAFSEDTGILGVLWIAGMGAMYVILQLALGAWSSPLSHATPRLLAAVAFVFCLGLVVGDASSRPMTYLYLPVVTVAAAFGRREALIVGGGAVLAYAVPRVMDETTLSALIQRGAAFLITMILLAVITRRTVGALESAIGRAREARRRERRRARQMAGIEAVGHLLARGSSTAALEELMDLMTRRFGYQNVSIYLLQEDGTVKLGAQRGYETVLESFDGTTGVVGRVMRTQETAFIRDVREDPDYRVAKGDVLSEISAPLMAAGELLGVLNVEDSRVDGLDDSDRSTMILIAERLAAAIALGREREAIAQRAELFQALAGFSRTVNASLDPHELYTVIVEALGAVMSSDIVALITRDTVLGDYRISTMQGGDQRFVGVRIPEGEGVSGPAIAERRLVVDSHLEKTAFPSTIRGGQFAEVMASAAVPLLSDDAVLGALAVFRTRPRAAVHAARAGGPADHRRPRLACHRQRGAARPDGRCRDPRPPDRPVQPSLPRRRAGTAAGGARPARRHRAPAGRGDPVRPRPLRRLQQAARAHRRGRGPADVRIDPPGSVPGRATSSPGSAARSSSRSSTGRASTRPNGRRRDPARARGHADPARRVGGKELHATVSAGCAAWVRQVSSMESLLEVADVGLQMAKRAGRNQVVAA